MKTIKIQSERLGRYQDSAPFLVEQGSLELRVELPAKSGEFFLVTDVNGKSGGAKLIPSDGIVSIIVSEAGELHAAVKHYLHGELIEVFRIEPLLLREVEKSLSAMPEIAEITEKISALREELTALKKTEEERFEAINGWFKDMSKWQRESDAAFLSFAYTTYKNSPLLNSKGLSFGQFAVALGFEEIEEINLEEKL